jgi:hypothetical protein
VYVLVAGDLHKGKRDRGAHDFGVEAWFHAPRLTTARS